MKAAGLVKASINSMILMIGYYFLDNKSCPMMASLGNIFKDWLSLNGVLETNIADFIKQTANYWSKVWKLHIHNHVKESFKHEMKKLQVRCYKYIFVWTSWSHQLETEIRIRVHNCAFFILKNARSLTCRHFGHTYSNSTSSRAVVSLQR